MAIFEFIEGWYNPHRRHFVHRLLVTRQLREEDMTQHAHNRCNARLESQESAEALNAESGSSSFRESCHSN